MRDLFRRFTNAHFATCADEYREGASYAAVKRRYEASAAAEKAFLDGMDAALEQMRLNGCEAVRRSEEEAKVDIAHLNAEWLSACDALRAKLAAETVRADANASLYQKQFQDACAAITEHDTLAKQVAVFREALQLSYDCWHAMRKHNAAARTAAEHCMDEPDRWKIEQALAATAASASAEVAMLRQRAESSEASLRHIAFTYCGTTLGENGTGFDDVAAFVEGQIDKQDERATRAETQLAAAREDTARLDWLDAHEASIEVNEIDPLTCRVQASDDFQAEGFSDPYKVRAAIDAARAAAK